MNNRPGPTPRAPCALEFAASAYTSFEATYLTWIDLTLALSAQSSVAGFARSITLQ